MSSFPAHNWPGRHGGRCMVALAALLSVVPACGARGIPDSSQDEAELRYAFHLVDTVSTGDLDQGEQSTTLEWEGGLRYLPATRYRDGSIGHLLQFLEVTTRQDGEPLEDGSLSGLSVEIRAFSSRELLGVNMLERIAGAPRHGDLLLPLWHAISPVIPAGARGAPTAMRSRVPLTMDRRRGTGAILDLTWIWHGREATEAGSSHRFTYEGTVGGSGRERTDDWWSDQTLAGTAEGQLWLRASDMMVTAHDLRWDVAVETSFAAPEGEPPLAEAAGLTLVQRHRWECGLRLAGAP